MWTIHVMKFCFLNGYEFIEYCVNPAFWHIDDDNEREGVHNIQYAMCINMAYWWGRATIITRRCEKEFLLEGWRIQNVNIHYAAIFVTQSE